MFWRSVSIFFMLLLAASVSDSAPSSKPRSPLSISISPADAGITPEKIVPGQTIDFKVIVQSVMEAEKMDINVQLSSSLQVLSGDTSWSGKIKKNRQVTMLMTVYVKGSGKIIAKAAIPGTGGKAFSTEAEYSLGENTRAKSLEKPPAKKDSKGRKLREYQ